MAGLDLADSMWPFDSQSTLLFTTDGEVQSAAMTTYFIPSQDSLEKTEVVLPNAVLCISRTDDENAWENDLDSELAIATPMSVASEHYIGALDQLAQIRTSECQRIRRIYQLEQALDQSMIYLEELKIKMQDYERLQSQLSVTEDFAYVQQHAIARLKTQIHEQKQVIGGQNADAHEYDDAVQMVLSYTEQLAEYQQAQLEHLRTRLLQDQTEEHQRRHRLEKQVEHLQTALTTQQEQVRKQESSALAARTLSASLEVQLEASQQQVKHLSIRLAESQTQRAALEQKLNSFDTVIAEKDDVQDALQRAQRVISEQNHHIATLKRDAAMAASQVEHLGQEQQQQLRTQSRWQHRCIVLEQECDRHVQHTTELVQQTSDMQEDILRYARQAGEYETAVQFWKDRYRASQRQITQFKELLERQVSYLPDAAAAEVQAALELTMPEQNSDSPPPTVLPAPQFNVLEMPEFLLKRHAFRKIQRVRSLSSAEPDADASTSAEI